MGRGGFRPNAKGKPSWKHGKTKTIRVPVALVDEILAAARVIDSGGKVVLVDPQGEIQGTPPPPLRLRSLLKSRNPLLVKILPLRPRSTKITLFQIRVALVVQRL